MLVCNSQFSPCAQTDRPPTEVELSQPVISEENRPTTVPTCDMKTRVGVVLESPLSQLKLTNKEEPVVTTSA